MAKGLGGLAPRRSAGKPLPTAVIPRMDIPGGQVVGFSGGKDSTALALGMADRGESFALLFTPTGNEPPELAEHIEAVRAAVDRPLVLATNGTLDGWIRKWRALRARRSCARTRASRCASA